MIRTILSWLRGPIVASTEVDYAGPRDYVAEARAETRGLVTVGHTPDGAPIEYPAARTALLIYPCWNEETRRGLTRHFYGRVGSRFVREPQCLNCGKQNPSMVGAK